MRLELQLRSLSADGCWPVVDAVQMLLAGVRMACKVAAYAGCWELSQRHLGTWWEIGMGLEKMGGVNA